MASVGNRNYGIDSVEKIDPSYFETSEIKICPLLAR